MTDDSSIVDRIWAQLEDRYGAEAAGCDCGASDETVAALDESALDREDLAAYRDGDASMADLLERADVDADPEHLDGLADLADALAADDNRWTASH